MKTVLNIAAGAVVMASALLMPGVGVAGADSAPDVIGKTYGEAKGMFGQAGMTPVVSTVLGDRATSQDQCFVTSMTKMTPLDSSGRTAAYNQVQVNLNCYAGQSGKNSPGYSKGNLGPEAVAVRETEDAATKKWKASAQGQKWCGEFEAEHPEWAPIPDCHSEAEAKEISARKWKATPEGQEWCAASEVQHPEWAPIPDCHPTETQSAT